MGGLKRHFPTGRRRDGGEGGVEKRSTVSDISRQEEWERGGREMGGEVVDGKRHFPASWHRELSIMSNHHQLALETFTVG